MLKKIFDYYGFSKAEQRGFFMLVLLIAMVVVAQLVYDRLIQYPVLDHQIIYFAAPSRGEIMAESTDDAPPVAGYEHHAKKKVNVEYFEFDPNGMSAEKWQRLGFSAKQAAAIKNYEANGGLFLKKEDVAKLYVVSEGDYARIAPYIVIKERRKASPKNEERSFLSTEHREKAVLSILDINEADTSDFKRLRGIGSVLASRAVRYREALGGFHAISQIGEVYGISAELFEAIQPFLEVGANALRKLNVNSASMDELSKHPYITKKQAQIIVHYRTQHGMYGSFADLGKLHALDEVFLRKIEPYIEW